MESVDVNVLKMRIEAVLPILNEYQRRRYLSAEAKSLGHGGITLVSSLSGISRSTLTAGIKELDTTDAEVLDHGRSRKPGGGRKPIWESSPGILDALLELVEAYTKGDPMRMLIWTNKSLCTLSEELGKKGYSASKDSVSDLLKMLGYGLQADKKTLAAKPPHPDRNAQFEHINDEAKKAMANGNPVLSIDFPFRTLIQNPLDFFALPLQLFPIITPPPRKTEPQISPSLRSPLNITQMFLFVGIPHPHLIPSHIFFIPLHPLSINLLMNMDIKVKVNEGELVF